MAKLVIVESPAKAKTISRFLGSDFVVEASIGHVADLPEKGLGVDVDNGFKPTYEITRPDVIRTLKRALKDADELYLATDEDREGEAISWHLLDELKPTVPVKRMVFHEITRQAIEHAVEHWRAIDYGLVDAQETRRILDRLYGFEVSPVLWRKVGPGTSAGRVQSPAVRLIVERERERMRFRAAGYWDLTASFTTDPAFRATLVAVDGRRVATGRDFDQAGQPRGDVLVLDEPAVRGLADRLGGARFTVASVEEKPYRSSPKPPFITSTLQQEGGRKLGMGAQQVMRVAQGLYERGYITYMRTDSVVLSEQAVRAARSEVARRYGDGFLPEAPRTYRSKARNAQEAHEAIRPAGETFRSPDQVRGELTPVEARLYELIWQRTLASQMADAAGRTVSVRLGAPSSAGERTEWAASGRTITFPGYLRVYVEGSDDPDAALDDRETILPSLAEGQAVPLGGIEADGHTTQPPPRYTEASLVKRLEELGIGRPSTYASIMDRIQARLVRKKGTALVPTWTAFAVVNLMENHLDELVDYGFTARMEDDLDEIALGHLQRLDYLTHFYWGNGRPGLKKLVTDHVDEIDAAAVNTIPLGVDADGVPVVVKPGRYGPYVKRGEETASVPDELAPDEVTLERALELLAAPRGDTPIGHDPESGLPVYAKSGRYGPYVQLGDADTLPDGEKPKMASLFRTMDLASLTLDDALELLRLPRTLGIDPADGEEVVAANGRYGPYVKKGTESRSLDDEAQLLTITLDEALARLAQPKQYRGRGAPKPPLRDLGADPATGKPMVVKDGRYGPYVTDGDTNASVPRGELVEELTAERASELLEQRRAAGPSPRRAKKATAKKATAKKATAKKATAKKATAKKATAKKATTAEAGDGRTTQG